MLRNKWQDILLRYADRMLGKEFEWGRTDCVTLCTSALSQIYEEDLFKDAPVYDDKYSAMRKMAEYGGYRAIRNWLEEHGWEYVRLSFMRPPDIVVFRDVDDEDINGMGVVIYPNFYLTSDVDSGVVARRLHHAVGAHGYRLKE